LNTSLLLAVAVVVPTMQVVLAVVLAVCLPVPVVCF
jgi:hypothetical protein